MTTGADIVAIAVAITSSRKRVYVFGAHPVPTEDDPSQFDCSGFVGWVCGRRNISLGAWPPYTVTQWNACKQAGTTIGIDEAVSTPGALLFNHRRPDGTLVDPPPGFLPADFHAHVAISRGDGSTVEAMNPAAGVGIGNARPTATRWSGGALIPGVVYGSAGTSSTAGKGTSVSPAAPMPTFPGEAGPGSPAAIVLPWQLGMIACGQLDDNPFNRDGDFGDGMSKKMTAMQTSFGWTDPDGRGGTHTWAHMFSRAHPPCPRCGN